MKWLRVGIIGCGFIGTELAKLSKRELSDITELSALYDVRREKAVTLGSFLKCEHAVVKSADEVFKKSDLIIECASPAAVKPLLERAIKGSKSILIMSVGGLIRGRGLLSKAREKGVNVYLPSGAIAGIDGLKAAKLSAIRKVTLTTRKPPRGLEGAPYLKKKDINLRAIKKETVIFEGNASEAVKAFPKNVNVASVLSIAGLGAKKTKVRIATSPKYRRNTHEIEIEGGFGRISIKAENVPSENPRTSKLAALSAMATLWGIADSVKIGT